MSAEGLFNEALEVDVIVHDDATNTFRTYYTPPSTHALSTAASPNGAASVEMNKSNLRSGGQVVFVCVHGAGYSALSFARFAQAICQSGCGVLSYDSRGHGASRRVDIRCHSSSCLDRTNEDD